MSGKEGDDEGGEEENYYDQAIYSARFLFHVLNLFGFAKIQNFTFLSSVFTCVILRITVSTVCFLVSKF